MYKYNKKNLKNYLELNEQNSMSFFSRNTVNGILRSLLEPIACANAKSLILTRFKNTQGIDGIIKRLEYCSNVEMFSFLDPDVVQKDDLVELEFIVITSHRYNAVLVWDYSQDEDKALTKLYMKVNSKDVNEIFEIIKEKSKIPFDEKFYSFRPERRENALLNEAMFNVLKILNENVKENEYNFDIVQSSMQALQTQNALDKINANLRHSCHEIKNQLSILDIYSKILEKQLGENVNVGLMRKSLSLIRLQLDELRAMDNLNLEERDLKEIINDSISVFEHILKEKNNKIKFVDTTSNKVNVFVDEDRFFAVLNNVVKNADESTSNDEIEIRLETDEKSAKIFIKNHGTKIPEEIQNQLFKEGFSTKTDGWGVGLSVCRKYLAQQLGSISLVKSDENETEFLITIALSSIDI